MTATDAQRPAVFVERALAAATLPCVAYVHETTAANLRWAGNTLTTNGDGGLPFLAAVTTGVGGVPEPANWALLIGGFALTGAAVRRRKAHAALA